MVSIKRNSKGEFAEAKGLRVRKSSIYEPGQEEVFKISRSKFSNFMDCERCFYLDRVKGLQEPGMPIFIEIAEQEIPKNFTVFSASAARETAKILPEVENGLFSYFLMKGLEGETDSDNDNQITNGKLHAFINNNVSRQANQTLQLSGDASRILVQW